MMATTGPGTPLETLSVFTALGIQFQDQALNMAVTDGLSVLAWLQGTDYPPVAAFRTASGNYAFQGLPCMHRVEYPDAQAVVGSPVRKYPFVIAVMDTLQRYLPMAFVVELPLDYPGLFLSDRISSPVVSPGGGARAYLFSAPTRSKSAGTGVVRANLWDLDINAPASFAAVEVFIEGQRWTGISDQRGVIQIQFPSPMLQRLSLGSPPGSGQGPASGMMWPVEVTVSYQPEVLRYPLSSFPDVGWPWTITPSLKSILGGQEPARIWQTENGPPVLQWSGAIVYGEELILRTTLDDASKMSSYLNISRVTSP